MCKKSTTTDVDRRTVLGTIAAGTVSLAGCSLLGTGTSTDSQSPAQPPDSSPIESISYETSHTRTSWEITLAVGLGDSTDVSRLNLIAPDGAVFGQTGVPSGATKATFTVDDSSGFEPGEYTLVALNGSEKVGEHPFNYSPSVSIAEIFSGKQDNELNETALAVRLKNTGNAPGFLRKLVWKNGPQTVRDSWDESPYDGSAVRGFVKPGGEATVVLEEFLDPGFDCPDGFSEEATVTANLSPGSDSSRIVTFVYEMVDEERCLAGLKSVNTDT